LEGSLQLRLGGLDLILIFEREAQVVMCSRQIRFAPDGLLKLFHGAVEIALPHVCGPEVDARHIVRRVRPRNLEKLRDAFVGWRAFTRAVARLLRASASAGFKSHRMLVGIHGGGQVPGLLQRYTQRVPYVPPFGIQRYGGA